MLKIERVGAPAGVSLDKKGVKRRKPMGDMKKTGSRQDFKRVMENLKAANRADMGERKMVAGEFTAPKLQALKLPKIAPLKTNKAEKSGNTFYTNKVNGGTISTYAKPISSLKSVSNFKPASSIKPLSNPKPAGSINPVSSVQPMSLAQFRKEIAVLVRI
jgi:hypothetical protein